MSAATVVYLRKAGHDTLWIRETAPGSTDREVLDRAQTESRILLTFDKDFGELVFHCGVKASRGIILFRISQPSPTTVAQRICAILASRVDWEGHYSVVDDVSLRMRKLPQEAAHE